jgi:flagellar biosynthesis/type III secretory pathway chaperone
MDRVLLSLTKLVEREVQAFRELLDLLTQQRDCIVDRRVDDLTCVVEQEEALIAETRDLERRRERQVEELSGRLGRPGEMMTLAQIIEAVEGAYAIHLSELRDSLLTVMGKLQMANERNRFLIEHALGYVDHHIRLLTTQDVKGASYTQQGSRDAELRSILVNQVA